MKKCPGWKVSEVFFLSSTKMFFTAYVLCSRRLTKLKLGKQYKQNTSPKKKTKEKRKKNGKKKTEIKIFANPDSA